MPCSVSVTVPTGSSTGPTAAGCAERATTLLATVFEPVQEVSDVVVSTRRLPPFKQYIFGENQSPVLFASVGTESGFGAVARAAATMRYRAKLP